MVTTANNDTNTILCYYCLHTTYTVSLFQTKNERALGESHIGILYAIGWAKNRYIISSCTMMYSKIIYVTYDRIFFRVSGRYNLISNHTDSQLLDQRGFVFVK